MAGPGFRRAVIILTVVGAATVVYATLQFVAFIWGTWHGV